MLSLLPAILCLVASFSFSKASPLELQRRATFTPDDCTSDQTAILTKLITQIQQDLPTVQADANKLAQSVFGFPALFKNKNPPVIFTYLDPITTTHSGFQPNIELWCVNAGGKWDAEYQKWLQYNSTLNGTAPQGGQARAAPGANAGIWIYPSYTQNPPPENPSNDNCPTFTPDGTVIHDSAELSNNLYGVLAHAIAYKLLNSAVPDPDFETSLQTCLDLSGGDQDKNPQNYAMYICGLWSTKASFLLYQLTCLSRQSPV